THSDLLNSWKEGPALFGARMPPAQSIAGPGGVGCWVFGIQAFRHSGIQAFRRSGVQAIGAERAQADESSRLSRVSGPAAGGLSRLSRAWSPRGLLRGPRAELWDPAVIPGGVSVRSTNDGLGVVLKRKGSGRCYTSVSLRPPPGKMHLGTGASL